MRSIRRRGTIVLFWHGRSWLSVVRPLHSVSEYSTQKNSLTDSKLRVWLRRLFGGMTLTEGRNGGYIVKEKSPSSATAECSLKDMMIGVYHACCWLVPPSLLHSLLRWEVVAHGCKRVWAILRNGCTKTLYVCRTLR